MGEDIFVVAIDGHSGSGKSTIGRLLADRLSAIYVDTGAMYRAVTAKALDDGIDIDDEDKISSLACSLKIDFKEGKLYISDKDYSLRIREKDVDENVSKVSSYSLVRKVLVSYQRKFFDKRSVVMEGRDISTVVFPDARYKFFFTADISMRSKRRAVERDSSYDPDKVSVHMKNLQKRDEIDSNRQDSPLKIDKNAILIDTSNLTIDEVLSKVLSCLTI